MPTIHEADRVLSRCEYLMKVARVFEIPVIATTQNALRLGPLHPSLSSGGIEVIDKMSFSCWKDPIVSARIKEHQKDQIVVVGVETHICVGLTVNDLVEQGFEVVVCPDAVSSGSLERHKLGMERIRDAGAVPVHTEGAAYEWTQRADDAGFKPVLNLTKQFR